MYYSSELSLPGKLDALDALDGTSDSSKLWLWRPGKGASLHGQFIYQDLPRRELPCTRFWVSLKIIIIIIIIIIAWAATEFHTWRRTRGSHVGNATQH